MFAPDPRASAGANRSPRVASRDEPLSPDILAEVLAVLRPASTAILIRAAQYDLRGGFDAFVRGALQRSSADPAEVETFYSGPSTLVAILTPRSDHGLDPVAIHAVLRSFDRQLRVALPPEVADEIVLLPVAPVPSLDALQNNLAALNELLDALLQKKFNVHFQPIVHFTTGAVFGYEALIRVPQTGVLKKPGMFFRAADKARLVSWMDINCSERCFEEAARAGVRDYLFINMDAEGLSHLQLSGYDLPAQARVFGVSPSQVVLEITERQAVDDFPVLAQYIDELRDHGFKIAVDDAGSGYNSLRTIAELRPDFVKIDRSLVRTLQDNGPRRALLSTITRFATQVGAAVIAEGCETRDELAAVIECGVTYGQGYILARPDDKFKGVRREIKEFISDRMGFRATRQMGDSYPIERMARRGVTLGPEAPGSEAAHKFRKFPDMEAIAVVTPEGRVEGLLTRTKWEAIGIPADTTESVRAWMDSRPLVVEADASLEAVAARATYRPAAQFQDDLVVARGGQFIGLVPMRALLDAVVTRKVNSPRYEHPVTGLPMMASIERDCNEWIASGRPFAVALAEIAYFRPFNQHFGLAAGDDLLRAAAGLIASVVGDTGKAAHLHGNDFLFAVEPDRLEAVCRELVAQFATAAHVYYSVGDRKAGELITSDPSGQRRRVPLVALRVYGIRSDSREMPTFSQGYRHLLTFRLSARKAGLPANESAYRIA